jgi:DNA helicase II / ATP-dependent DNA helicase PcrA
MPTLEYRIYGPPGTGKTTWIAKKATELADLFGPDQISICSMTRAAVREVMGRDLRIPDENITTLHARCKRALMTGPPAESGIKDFAEKYPSYVSSDCIPAYLSRGIKKGDEEVSETMLAGGGMTLYEQCQILRQQMIEPSRWSPRVSAWFSAWSSWMRSEGMMDYTGWLEACLGGGLLPAQQAVFIDEAQDHTPLQLSVIRGWKTEHLFLIGDDDQNLYEWSGAIPDTFLNSNLPPEREKVLEQSYRIPRSVHGIASRWISSVPGRVPKAYLPRDHEGSVEYSDYQISDSSQGILPEFGEGRVMILTTCAYMLSDIIMELKREGIPFGNPYRRSDAFWNPLDKPLSIIRAFMVGDRDWTGLEVERWFSILSDKAVLARGKKRKDLIEECRRAGTSPAGSIVGKYLSEEAMELAISQDLLMIDKMRKIGIPGDWNYAIRVARTYGPEASPRITVGTVHSVKGGEADHVILFPDLSPAGFSEYISSHRDRIMRIFYVGMTRTKDRLTFCERSTPRAVDWI